MSPHQVWTSWDLQPLTLAGLAGAGFLYGRGLAALWSGNRPGRGIRRWQALSFFVGLFFLFVALVSPLHRMSQALLSAHMSQHLLLIAVAAPLVVLGSPGIPMGKAMPRTWREAGRRMARRPALLASARALRHPVISWLLALVTLWGWHAPVLYQAALRHEWIHVLEHASFFGTAVLFWWTALQPSGPRRLERGVDVLYVFTGSFQGAALGFLFTFAAVPIYPLYAATVRPWGLTPLQDQHLAGVIMWLPTGVIYLVAAGGLFLEWLRATERATRRLDGRLEAVSSTSRGSR
jgi:putative membrane protein